MTGNKEKIVLFLMGQEDKEKLWDLSEHEEKRSKNQNSYYRKLIGELARRTKISSNEIHNRYLRQLGLVERVNGRMVTTYVPDTDEGERWALEAETYHIKPTSGVMMGKDGVLYRCYVVLRGSSTFTVAEFSSLVDLAVQDAKEQGIETMTPAELAHLRELERRAEERRCATTET